MHLWSEAKVVDRLREMYPPGIPVERRECSAVEVRHTPGEAVLLLRWDQDPHLYGVPIDLTDRSRDFYYTSTRVRSDREWLDSVGLGLLVMFGTGFRTRAARRLVGDYIELRTEGGWPTDDRFYMQDVDDTAIADSLRWQGFDIEAPRSDLLSGRLLAWVLAYVNTAPSGPDVGHASISRTGPTSGHLRNVEVAEAMPASLRLDLAYETCHAAAEAGAQTITTDSNDRFLELVGFRADEGGRLILDCSFLQAQPDARARLKD